MSQDLRVIHNAISDTISDIKNDSKKAAETAGMLLAMYPGKFQRFARTHGKFLFEKESIKERIDFLLPVQEECACFRPRDLKTFKENIEWKSLDDDSIVIKDINNQFNDMELNLGINKDEIYFITDGYDEWQFYYGGGEIYISDPLCGFMNIYQTRMSVFMIRWVTNLLNFKS